MSYFRNSYTKLVYRGFVTLSTSCFFVSNFSRHMAEQAEGRVSKLKEELVTVKEALGKIQLQKDVVDGEKEEAGKPQFLLI